ncbi:threonine/homoserine efflux transporter RhtA [Tamaricihabitans halophyticus]|uniref:Threonine/homoserine efflux transporter RhtA n=1 Tax=Tamaricihabitans halophyticus TaxID=1262583 RepID=A0A4R2QWA9_9PSEU|nr:EamA family transporter [Tamaricihabitans halophyticus]TCP53987.1 threonine/homoserine efflux transporter RhtA [Tamaricihabitans halophyticus]
MSHVSIRLALPALWLCWGSSFPALRVLVETLPPLLASGAVFLAAGLLLALARPRALVGLARRQVLVAAGTGVCLLGAQGAVAVALREVYAGTAALVVAAVPLWVAVFRGVLGGRPTIGGVGRVLLGFAGVLLVLLVDAGSWSVGVLVVLAASVGWAAGTLWAAWSAALTDPWATTILQLGAGGLTLLLGGLAVGETPVVGEPNSWLALGYLVLVDSLAGFALYNWLLRSAPLAVVSSYAYVVPVVAYLIGVLVFAEPFVWQVLPGIAAIVLAVASEVRNSSGSGRVRNASAYIM